MLALVMGGFGLAVLALVPLPLREAVAMKRWPVRVSFLLLPLVLPLESMAVVLQCYGSFQP
jgi:hypothetical protein